MPELPEVEVLVRHLAPLLRGQTIQRVEVRIPRSISSHRPSEFQSALTRAQIMDLRRRAKYLLFTLKKRRAQFELVGHLGMTGRMYLAHRHDPVPRHAAVILHFADQRFIFEDARRFGRLTLGNPALERLGPEPLEPGFRTAVLRKALQGSTQAIKVKLMDQSVVAGIGNIYASEILFRARLDPRRRAGSLKSDEVTRLRHAIVKVLSEAIRLGSTIPLDFAGQKGRDGLFYFGQAADSKGGYEERLRVYDREEQSCLRCRAKIRRIVQAARSTFFCPKCQR